MMINLRIRLSGKAEEIFNELLGQGVSEDDITLDAFALLHFGVSEVKKGKKVGSFDSAKREFQGIQLSSLNPIPQKGK